MNKTQKELAFLRELTIESEWTERFTDYLDKKIKFADKAEKVLYINAGAGNYPIALSEKLHDQTEIYAVCESEDLRNIAQAKADAVRVDVRFGTNLPSEKYDVVLADGSFVEPFETEEFVEKVIDASKNRVAFFLPTKGSFGEIYSFLWEALFEAGLTEKVEHVERLIGEIPTIEQVEAMAKNLGLRKVEHSTENELFEFKNGAEFVDSTLAANFLFPAKFDFLEPDEIAKVSAKLAELIDAEEGEVSFRFTVKNSLFTGKI